MVLILALPVPLDPTTRRTTRSALEFATPAPAPTLALAPIRHDTAYQEMADADALYVLLSGTVALKSLVDTRSGRRVAAPAGFGLEALLYLVESKPPPRLESATALTGCECAVFAREHLRAVLQVQAEEEHEWLAAHPGLALPRTEQVGLT